MPLAISIVTMTIYHCIPHYHYSPTAQCPELELIVNCFITYDPDITPDFDIGTEATYQCDPGFNLVGVMVRSCTLDIDVRGVWTEDPPMCERKDVYCKNSV